MARKADEDLLAELDQLGSEDQATAAAAASKKGKDASATASVKNDEEDAFAEIEKQLAAKPAGTSRPSTPRLNSNTTSATTNKSSPKRAEFTPSMGSSERNSSDAAQVRSSGEGSRSFHQGVSVDTEKTEESVAKSAASSGGWWGSSLLSAASAAVKQAESLAKEIRGNEEAQKWAEQVRGNMRGLQEFGTDLRSRALPTFTSLISHIAPPISAHERLQIHTTHDIQNYPSLDPLIYAPFARIMAQVEGGDLMVLQRGSESRVRSSSGAADEQGYRGRILGGASSWTDGPWWREQGVARSLGAVAGLREGTRLARVSAEAYAKEFFDSRGGVEEAAKRATESLSEMNPVRSSDIFLAIQPVRYTIEKDLFADSSAMEAKKDGGEGESTASDDEDEVVVFAIYLHDPIHSLSFRTLSQPFPARWATWLDGEGGLPESIQEIIHAGGVDPRDWVAEWMEEVLSVAVGIVAQGYVAKRMGVGEGSLGKGKQPVEGEASAGEAARAV